MGETNQVQGGQQDSTTGDSIGGEKFVPMEQFTKMQGTYERHRQEMETQIEQYKGAVVGLQEAINDLRDEISIGQVGSGGESTPELVELKKNLRKKERELETLKPQALQGAKVLDAYTLVKENGLDMNSVEELLNCNSYAEMQVAAKNIKIKILETGKTKTGETEDTSKTKEPQKPAGGNFRQSDLDSARNTVGGGSRRVTPSEVAKMNPEEFVKAVREGKIQVGQ